MMSERQTKERVTPLLNQSANATKSITSKAQVQEKFENLAGSVKNSVETQQVPC